MGHEITSSIIRKFRSTGYACIAEGQIDLQNPFILQNDNCTLNQCPTSPLHSGFHFWLFYDWVHNVLKIHPCCRMYDNFVLFCWDGKVYSPGWSQVILLLSLLSHRLPCSVFPSRGWITWCLVDRLCFVYPLTCHRWPCSCVRDGAVNLRVHTSVRSLAFLLHILPEIDHTQFFQAKPHGFPRCPLSPAFSSMAHTASRFSTSCCCLFPVPPFSSLCLPSLPPSPGLQLV